MGRRVWSNWNENMEYWKRELRIMGVRVWNNGNEGMG